MHQHLNFPTLLNARDLGGYPRRNGGRNGGRTGGHTRSGQLIRADELGRLTADGLAALIDCGLRSVLDLRWPEEIARLPHSIQQGRYPAIQYIHASMLGPSAADWDSRYPTVVKETWNIAVLELAQVGLHNSLQAIANAPEGMLLFHCHSGKDRTGVLAALLLDLAEVEPEVIALDYSVTTERLRDAYLAKHPNEREGVLESVRCPAENIHTMLAHLHTKYGGTAGYMRTIGLRESEIASLQTRLT